MPRKFELTWQVGAGGRCGRWRKKYKGQVLYFASGSSKSDLDGYRQALIAWKQAKQQIDASSPKPFQAEYAEALGEWTQVLEWSVEHDDQRTADVARTMISQLRERMANSNPPPIGDSDRFWSRFGIPKKLLNSIAAALPKTLSVVDANSPSVVIPSHLMDSLDGSPDRIQREIWKDRLAIQNRSQRDSRDTVEGNVEMLLINKRAQVDAGELSAGRFDPLRGHLHHFRDWLGGSVHVSSIKGKTLSDYHAELLNGISTKKWSNDYAKDRMNAVKSFVRWLWTSEAIEELPRILNDRSKLCIGKRLMTPQVFTMDEVRVMLCAATPRTKLYLLLMLNTGMTQKDISDLKQTEVDWKKGVITRKRSKTAKHEHVPTVAYRLWKEAFRLLCDERSSDANHVFLNETGGHLKVEKLDHAWKLKNIDNITSAFNRLKRLTKIKKPLKLFRKTSASLLRGKQDFSGVEILFLGHAPRTIADRHYAQAPQLLLDNAIKWLGTQYGVK